MADNDIRVRISGETLGASNAINEVKTGLAGLGQAGGALGSITSGALAFGAALGGVAAVVAGGRWLAELAGRSIEAADRLGELATATGVSGETLSRYKLAAQNSGISVEDLASSLGRMNVKLGEARGGNESAIAGFTRLGFSLSEIQNMRPEEALKRIADRTKESGDASRLSSELNDVFGKSFQKMLPLLSQGSEGLDEAGKMADKLGLSLSSQVISRADQTSDAMGAVGSIMTGFGNQLMAEVLPTVKGLSDRFVNLVADSGAVAVAAKLVGGAFNVLVNAGQVVSGTFEILTTWVGGLAKAYMSLAQGEFKAAVSAIGETTSAIGKIATDTGKDITSVWKGTYGTFKESERAADALGNAAANLGNKTGNLSDKTGGLRDATNRQSDAARAAAREHERLVAAYASMISKIDEKVEALRREVAGAGALTAAEQLQGEVLRQLRDGKLRVTAAQWEEIRAKLAAIDALEQQRAVIEAARRADEEAQRVRVASIDNEFRAAGALEEAVRKQREQNAEFGLTATALAELEIRRLSDAQATLQQKLRAAELTSVSASEIEAIRWQIESYGELIALKRQGLDAAGMRQAAEAAKDAAKESNSEWVKAADSIQSSLTDALMRGFESGKDFAQNLVDTAKNLFQSLVLRPTIQAIVAPISAGVAGMLGLPGSAAAAGGGSGGASGIGSMLSSVGSLFGTGGLGGSLMAGAGWLSGATSFTGALSAAGSLMGTGSLGGIMSGLGMAAGALGPIALGAMALYSLFGGRRGGPKSGGSSILTSDLLAGVDPRAPGESRFYTPSDADAEVSRMTRSVIAGIQQTAGALGGSAGYFMAGLGYDTDPRGSAPNRISSTLFANGREVFGSMNRDVGRDNEALQQGLADEMSLLIFAGLRESSLPTRISEYLSSFDLAGLTGEEARAAIEAATAAQSMAQAVRDLGGVFGTFSGLTVEARSNIASLTGGLDAFVSKTGAFVSTYFSEEEQAGIAAAQVLRSLGAVGIDAGALTDKSQVRGYLDTLDLSSSLGQSQFAAILNTTSALGPLFDRLGGEAGTTLAELAAFSPGGAAYEVLVGSGDAATQTAQAVATQVELLQSIISQNAAAYARMIETQERMAASMERAESTADLYGAAGPTYTLPVPG